MEFSEWQSIFYTLLSKHPALLCLLLLIMAVLLVYVVAIRPLRKVLHQPRPGFHNTRIS